MSAEKGRSTSPASPARATRRSRPARRTGTAKVSEDRLVLAAVLDPIVTMDEEGVIQFASDSIETLLGWPPEELVGRSMNVLMPAPHRGRHGGYVARYRQTGTAHILGRPRTLDAQHRDGTTIPVELCVSRVDRPNGPGPLFVGILRSARHCVDGRAAQSAAERDLQERLDQQTAELQATHLRLRMADRMASVGTLSAGLGHDVNNVLLPVRAHLNAIEKLAASPEARRHIEAVRRAVAYLQQLSDGLHYLALDPERDNLDECTSLGEWWRQAGAILLKAVPRHVKVQTSMPATLPPVRVAPHRLTQAILNLVVNAGEAIPATRKGLVRVAAEAAPRRDALRLSVSDNGSGMTPEVRRRAFEIFFTTKPRGLGTGLGLALVRNVAERAGGAVDIESRVGRGTTVTMLLPISMPVNAGGGQTASTRVTISVDDARAADLLRHLLQHAGAEVHMDGDPEGTAVWILAPRADRLATAKAWASGGPRRRLLLFGEPLARSRRAWMALGPTVIDRPGELDAVRAALALVLSPTDAGSSPPRSPTSSTVTVRTLAGESSSGIIKTTSGPMSRSRRSSSRSQPSSTKSAGQHRLFGKPRP